jgi:hypothetical protein
MGAHMSAVGAVKAGWMFASNVRSADWMEAQ